MSTVIDPSSAVGPPPGMQVRLSSNESPFGPSPRAIEAATALIADAHRYPDDQAIALREALARHTGRAVEEIGVGTGSAALLMDAIPHVASGGEVLAFARSFIVYPVASVNADARYVEVETGGPATLDRDGYARDVDALLARITPATRVVVVDNPGNPTGAHLDGDQLRALVEAVPDEVTIIIDEAYAEFAQGQRGYATVEELGLEHPRLLVMRTFSKVYALAGLRVGYVIGSADVVGALDARRTRFNVAAPAQAAAVAALTDEAHVARTVEGTLEGRARMAEVLRELGVAVTAGLGNFVTIEAGGDPAPLVAAYAQHGVGVRDLRVFGMPEQIRVTVGTPNEVDAFLEASRAVFGDARADT